uniref:Isobutyryl-CoA dehydrogenase, mitochondrial n=1 Tax=Palpitomonas bilix TaxID=652834 RepID=A0A7S3GG02_9EUKA|mmetsp:Transcript_47704/g.123701  ORF Transcript_47704/g.123701 Transcript_47704/m.123701 type:complete len:447 (+) Transcript_47704:24-1364(+)
MRPSLYVIVITHKLILTILAMLGAIFRKSIPAVVANATVARSSVMATRAMSSKVDLFNPTSEHKDLRHMVAKFTKEEIEPQALEFNRDEKFNMDLFKKVGDLGLLGITVNEEYGGTGLDATAAVIVHEEMSASDPAFTLSYLAHSMLFANNLNFNGSAEQCAKYLPEACTGEKIGAMGMSEPSVGTDVLGMKTKAVRDGDHYVINGSKMWITNGAVSDSELGDYFLIYARTSEDKVKGVSFFLLEKGMEGFSLGQRIKDKCGMRASYTAELVFDNVKVPVENRVGEEGDAVLHMMRNLELERLVLAAMSLGIARRSIEVMVNYAKERHSFGKPLSSYGQIQKMIGDSWAEYQAGRAYVYNTASNLNLGVAGNRIDSDGVKLFCGDMGKRVADRAMQCLGGYGYVGDYVVERLWRDAKLLEIGGGTNEAHQKNMTGDICKLNQFPWV